MDMTGVALTIYLIGCCGVYRYCQELRRDDISSRFMKPAEKSFESCLIGGFVVSWPLFLAGGLAVWLWQKSIKRRFI